MMFVIAASKTCVCSKLGDKLDEREISQMIRGRFTAIEFGVLLLPASKVGLSQMGELPNGREAGDGVATIATDEDDGDVVGEPLSLALPVF